MNKDRGIMTPIRFEKGLAAIDYVKHPKEAMLTAKEAADMDEDDDYIPEVKTHTKTKVEPVKKLNKIGKLRVNAALELHQRIGHLHVPGNEVNCPECLIAKGPVSYTHLTLPTILRV